MNQILAGIIVAPIFATAVFAQTSESLAEVKRAIDKGNAQ